MGGGGVCVRLGGLGKVCRLLRIRVSSRTGRLSAPDFGTGRGFVVGEAGEDGVRGLYPGLLCLIVVRFGGVVGGLGSGRTWRKVFVAPLSRSTGAVCGG